MHCLASTADRSDLPRCLNALNSPLKPGVTLNTIRACTTPSVSTSANQNTKYFSKLWQQNNLNLVNSPQAPFITCLARVERFKKWEDQSVKNCSSLLLLTLENCFNLLLTLDLTAGGQCRFYFKQSLFLSPLHHPVIRKSPKNVLQVYFWWQLLIFSIFCPLDWSDVSHWSETSLDTDVYWPELARLNSPLWSSVIYILSACYCEYQLEFRLILFSFVTVRSIRIRIVL